MAAETLGSSGYMFDPESPEELVRLIMWDRLTTQAMGGVLGEQSEETIAGLRRVLDLACGPGSWVLDLAFLYPDIEVAGVDISRGMVNYANARAKTQKLPNASFGEMDITQPLDFSDNSFDLVNGRSLVTSIHQDTYPKFITECTRILRPGGVLRLTELLAFHSTSPAYNEWNGLMLEAMYRIGYGFSTDGRSINITTVLPQLFRKAGYENVQHRTHTLEVVAGWDNWADGYHNLEVGIHMSQPLLTQLGLITSEALQKLMQQFLMEGQRDDFIWMLHYMTVWGTKPAA